MKKDKKLWRTLTVVFLTLAIVMTALGEAAAACFPGAAASGSKNVLFTPWWQALITVLQILFFTAGAFCAVKLGIRLAKEPRKIQEILFV